MFLTAPHNITRANTNILRTIVMSAPFAIAKVSSSNRSADTLTMGAMRGPAMYPPKRAPLTAQAINLSRLKNFSLIRLLLLSLQLQI